MFMELLYRCLLIAIVALPSNYFGPSKFKFTVICWLQKVMRQLKLGRMGIRAISFQDSVFVSK